jgi:hypothetical protein
MKSPLPSLAILVGLTLWGCAADFEALDARACQRDQDCATGACLHGFCQEVSTPDAQDDTPSDAPDPGDADMRPDQDLSPSEDQGDGGEDAPDQAEDTNDIEEIDITDDTSTPDADPGDAPDLPPEDLPEDLVEDTAEDALTDLTEDLPADASDADASPEDMPAEDAIEDAPDVADEDLPPADLCPEDPLKTEPGLCGCGASDEDGDGDQTADCLDGCPNDPDKVAPGVCGCGAPDVDTDNDDTFNCEDGCPNDPGKVAPGACGCGVPDVDTDRDGLVTCEDNCPALANPDQDDQDGDLTGDACDDDLDGDDIPNDTDNCPTNPNQGQADADDDGIGDACDPLDQSMDNPPSGVPRDLNGDGYADLVFTDASSGATFIVQGGATPATFEQNFMNPYAVIWPSELSRDHVAAENFGDLNGDDRADLVMGFPNSGHVAIYYGPLNPFSMPSLLLTGPTGFGRALNTRGDFNNDGLMDLVVATQGDDTQAVTIFYGGDDGIQPQRKTELTLPTVDYPFPLTLAAAHDLDGDFLDELFVGGGDINGGGVYVWFGSLRGPMPRALLVEEITPYFGVRIATNVGSPDPFDKIAISGVRAPQVMLDWRSPPIFYNARAVVTPEMSSPPYQGWYGLAVAIGDLDDNGYDDFLLGGGQEGVSVVLTTNDPMGLFGTGLDLDVNCLAGEPGPANMTFTGDLTGDGVEELVLGEPGCSWVFVGYQSEGNLSYRSISTITSGLGVSIGNGHSAPVVTSHPDDL